jgi:uncharacterized protein
MMQIAGPARTAGGLPWLKLQDSSVTLQVKVRPGASRTEIVRTQADSVVIALNAPPEKGKANQELVRMIAGMASVSRSAVSIVRGSAARHKLVTIATGHPRRVAELLASAAEKAESCA